VDPKAIIFWVYLGVAGVMAVTGVPFLLGRVPPNPFYGLRVGKTLGDPAAWYAGNRFMSWRMLWAAGLTASVATAAYALLPGLGLAAYAMTSLAATLGGVGFALVQTLRFLRRQ